MSIINSMLNDLDARLERQASGGKPALEGLYAADGIFSGRSQAHYRLIVLIGLVIILCLLVLTGGTKVASKTFDSAPSTSPGRSRTRMTRRSRKPAQI